MDYGTEPLPNGKPSRQPHGMIGVAYMVNRFVCSLVCVHSASAQERSSHRPDLHGCRVSNEVCR